MKKRYHRILAGLLCLMQLGSGLAFAAPEAETPEAAVQTAQASPMQKPDVTGWASEAAAGKTIGKLEDPMLTATAALLYNPDTDMMLYQMNADAPRYPASTTKIMTALLTLENEPDLEKTVTATAVDFEGMTEDSSNADIREGETMRIIDLLYCLMLPSANEAAYILARNVGGSNEQFVQMMNERAKELGCTNTNFANPCGLHDDNHYSTASDLLKITIEAMKNETFAEISSTALKKLPATNKHEERIVYTTNQLIYSSSSPWYYTFAKGIKTGSTNESGYCLVSLAEKQKTKLYSVVLGCVPDPEGGVGAGSFIESKKLLEWGFDNFKMTTLVEKDDAITECKVKLSADTDKIVLTVNQTLQTPLPTTIENVAEQMEIEIDAPEELRAPIEAGQVLGKVIYRYDGVVYGQSDLIALSSVEMSRVLYFADLMENFFSSLLFRIILAVLVILIFGYFATMGAMSRVRANQHRKRMKERYESSNLQRRRRNK